VTAAGACSAKGWLIESAPILGASAAVFIAFVFVETLFVGCQLIVEAKVPTDGERRPALRLAAVIALLLALAFIAEALFEAMALFDASVLITEVPTDGEVGPALAEASTEVVALLFAAALFTALFVGSRGA
jgi:hypothetical protein